MKSLTPEATGMTKLLAPFKPLLAKLAPSIINYINSVSIAPYILGQIFTARSDKESSGAAGTWRIGALIGSIAGPKEQQVE